MARRAPYRRLALLVVASVAAAALVIVPLLVRAAHSASATCLGPADAGTISIGHGIDAGVIALTVKPGLTATAPISVRMVNGPASAAARRTLWISGPGAPAVALVRREPGCWAAAVPQAVLASADVRGSAASGAPVLGHFAVPARPRSAAALLARARQATLGLAGVRELTLGRSSLAARPQAVVTDYAGSTVTSRSSYGLQRFSWPGWRSGFEWVVPGIQASVVLGAVSVDGVQAIRVAGAVAQTPVWMLLDIVPSSGVVIATSMNGPNHVMTNRYTSVAR